MHFTYFTRVLVSLLARLKSNYQLGELVMVDNYPESIQLMAKFTVESLQMWQFAPNSIHYLLSLWQRMVASVPYVKASVVCSGNVLEILCTYRMCF